MASKRSNSLEDESRNRKRQRLEQEGIQVFRLEAMLDHEPELGVMVALNLTFKQINDLCMVSKKFSDFCESYLREKFWISLYRGDLEPYLNESDRKDGAEKLSEIDKMEDTDIRVKSLKNLYRDTVKRSGGYAALSKIESIGGVLYLGLALRGVIVKSAPSIKLKNRSKDGNWNLYKKFEPLEWEKLDALDTKKPYIIPLAVAEKSVHRVSLSAVIAKAFAAVKTVYPPPTGNDTWNDKAIRVTGDTIIFAHIGDMQIGDVIPKDQILEIYRQTVIPQTEYKDIRTKFSVHSSSKNPLQPERPYTRSLQVEKVTLPTASTEHFKNLYKHLVFASRRVRIYQSPGGRIVSAKEDQNFLEIMENCRHLLTSSALEAWNRTKTRDAHACVVCAHVTQPN